MATITPKAARMLGLTTTSPSDVALDAAVDALGLELGHPVSPLGPSLAEVQASQAQRRWDAGNRHGRSVGL